MSGYAWLGIVSSAIVSMLAVIAYGVMALPYLDNAPFLTELRNSTRKIMLAGAGLFGLFLLIFYLGALFLDEATSGPLLIFAGVVISLPISLLLGSETWDRRNGHGMNNVPGTQAVAVATGIGLAELVGFSVAFLALFWIM